MFKKIGIFVVVVTVLVVMILFTRMNPGTVPLDLAFGVVEPSVPMAFAVTFVLGWAFGIFSAGMFMLRLANDRRRLRSALRNSESEVSRLRGLPIADAD